MNFKKATDLLFIPWTIWCLCVAVGLSFLIFPVFYVGLKFTHPKIKRFIYILPMYIARMVLFFWGVRMKVHCLDKFDQSKQYVFVGNHLSYLDACISSAAIPNLKKFIGKAELLKLPVIGYILDKMYIPVQREDPTSRKWSMEQLFEKTKDGSSMVVYPEGTCNASSEPLLPFKEGAFRLSAGLNLPIVIFTSIGADKLWHRKSLHIIKPGVLNVYFSAPIFPKGNNEEDIHSLSEEVKNEILKSLKQYSI
jgi:1-acyl-sn-glycerol-3-phosphate acyltransferase